MMTYIDYHISNNYHSNKSGHSASRPLPLNSSLLEIYYSISVINQQSVDVFDEKNSRPDIGTTEYKVRLKTDNGRITVQ